MDEDIGSSAPAPEETTADQQGATAAAVEQAETAQSSQVSDEEVKRRLLVLLGHSDLTKTTGDWMGWLTAAAASSTCPVSDCCCCRNPHNCRKDVEKAVGEGSGCRFGQQEGFDTPRGELVCALAAAANLGDVLWEQTGLLVLTCMLSKLASSSSSCASHRVLHSTSRPQWADCKLLCGDLTCCAGVGVPGAAPTSR